MSAARTATIYCVTIRDLTDEDRENPDYEYELWVPTQREAISLRRKGKSDETARVTKIEKVRVIQTRESRKFLCKLLNQTAFVAERYTVYEDKVEV